MAVSAQLPLRLGLLPPEQPLPEVPLENQVVWHKHALELRPRGCSVAIFPRWVSARIRSERYAVTNNLRLAVSWGQLLYGGRSFVIVQDDKRRDGGRYVTLGIEPISASDLKLIGKNAVLVQGAEYRPFRGLVWWFPHQNDAAGNLYRLRALLSVEGRPIFPGYPNPMADDFQRELNETAVADGTLDRGWAEAVAFGEIDALLGDGPVGDLPADVRDEASDRLAEYDEFAFSIARSDQRVRYIEALTLSWKLLPPEDRRLDRAVVALVKSIPEKQALVDTWSGLHTDLRAKIVLDLDHHLWDLLVDIGERFDNGPLGLEDFKAVVRSMLPENAVVDLIVGMPQPPTVPELRLTALQQVATYVDALIAVIEGAVESNVELITEPEKVAEAYAQLMTTLVIFDQATKGNPVAIEQVIEMGKQMGKRALYGWRAARLLGLKEAILARARAALFWEIVSIFVSPGSLVAGAQSLGEAGKRLARLGGFMKTAKGKVPDEALADVVKAVDHVDELIVKESDKLADAAQAGRATARVADDADLAAAVPELAKPEALAAKTIAELPGPAAAKVEKLKNAAEALTILEKKLGGTVSDNVVRGLKRLDAQPRLTPKMLNVLAIRLGNAAAPLKKRGPPRVDLETFMTAIQKVPDISWDKRFPKFFDALSEHKELADFLARERYEVFAALASKEVADYDYKRLAQYVRVIEQGGQMVGSQKTRDALRQKLLRGIEDKDPKTLARLEERRQRMLLQAGRLPSLNAEQIAALVDKTPDIRDFRRISKRYAPGTRGSLFERWLLKYVFDPKFDFKVQRVYRKADNPGVDEFLTSTNSRRCDLVWDLEGPPRTRIIYEIKNFDEETAFDFFQAGDYDKMTDAGPLRDFANGVVGPEHEINSIVYLFSDRESAVRHWDELNKGLGFEVAYINDAREYVHMNSLTD